MSCLVLWSMLIPFIYTFRAPLLPMPPLPDIAHDQSAVLGVDATGGNYSSLLSGHPAPLASSSGETPISAQVFCGAAALVGGAGRFSNTLGMVI